MFSSRPNFISASSALAPFDFLSLRELRALRVLCVRFPFLFLAKFSARRFHPSHRYAANLFRIRTYAKSTRNSFRMRTSKKYGLKVL